MIAFYLVGCLLPLTFSFLPERFIESLFGPFLGRAFSGLLHKPELFFNVFYLWYFSTFIARAINNSLYFLGRKLSQPIGIEEFSIISSVKKIREYDIFVFEVTCTFLLHFLYFILLLIATRLGGGRGLRSYNPAFLRHSLLTFSIVYLRSICAPYGEFFASMAFVIWEAFGTDFLFSSSRIKLSFSAELIQFIKIFVPLFFFFQLFYNNFLKIRQLRNN